jgi:hypothetical protein
MSSPRSRPRGRGFKETGPDSLRTVSRAIEGAATVAASQFLVRRHSTIVASWESNWLWLRLLRVVDRSGGLRRRRHGRLTGHLGVKVLLQCCEMGR